MAILEVKRVSQHGHEGSFDSEYVRKYRETWQVLTDDVNERASAIMLHPFVPKPWQQYVGDTWAYAQLIRPRQDPSNRLRWFVDVDYSSKIDDPSKVPSRQGDSPLGNAAGGSSAGGAGIFDRSPRHKWGTQVIEEAFEYEVPETAGQGDWVNPDRAITNSSKQKFVPSPTHKRRVTSLTISRPESKVTFDYRNVSRYLDCMNSDSFLGWSPKHALMADITADEAYEQGVFFWNVSYQILFREDDWDFHPLDCGTAVLSLEGPTGNMVLREIVLESGAPATTPVLLNGAGQRLQPDNASPVYLTYRQFQSRAFSDLNLLITT